MNVLDLEYQNINTPQKYNASDYKDHEYSSRTTKNILYKKYQDHLFATNYPDSPHINKSTKQSHHPYWYSGLRILSIQFLNYFNENVDNCFDDFNDSTYNSHRFVLLYVDLT